MHHFISLNPVTAGRDLTLEAFVEDDLYRRHHGLFPLLHESRRLGCIGAARLKGMPRVGWDLMRVGEVFVR